MAGSGAATASRRLELSDLRSPSDLARLDPRVVTRLVLVLCQARIVQLTWPLWQRRDLPPNLPMIDGLDGPTMGWVLLASLVPVLARPRWGLPLHAGVLALALAFDQLRLRPESIVLAILLLGTGRWRASPTVAWVTLSSMWLWAGLTKIASANFEAATVVPIVERFDVGGLQGLLVWAIPLAEVALGAAAAWPATRRRAGWAGAAAHVAIVVMIGGSWSWPVVWWGVGCGAAALGLLSFGPAEPKARTRRGAGLRTAAVAAVFGYPALTYVGVVDPYLSHHTYTGDIPKAQVCDASGCSSFAVDVTGAALRGVVPGAPRIYRAWFAETCLPGQELRITGLRVRPPLDRLAGADSGSMTCPN